jgi:hypothetical protein
MKSPSTPAQRLASANSNLIEKQNAEKDLRLRIRTIRSDLAQTRANLATPHGIANRKWNEELRAAEKASQAELIKIMPQYNQAKAELERARTNHSAAKIAVDRQTKQLAEANRSQPQTDNVKPNATVTRTVDAVNSAAPVPASPAPGQDGQAPEATPAPSRTPVEKTAATAQGGKKTTPEQDLPEEGAAEERVSSTSVPLPAPLEPELIPEVRNDHRIRLSAFDGRLNESAKERLYGVSRDPKENILAPLWQTDGVLFPYTPTIQVSQDTTWQTADLEHSNFDILSFQKTSSAQITLTGKFTVQNEREGRYLLAVIHFLRTVSKAYFGAQDIESFAPVTGDQTAVETTDEVAEKTRSDGLAGLPPPVLLFSGYGTMMFNDLRVVVKSHSWAYEETADLVKIELPSDGVSPRTVWLPPMMTINMTLSIQNNTDRVRERFKLDDFRTGALLKTRGWF